MFRSFLNEAEGWQTLGWASGLALLLGASAAAADDSKGVAFFESKIRPVLVEHCYQCHSAAKAEGELRLDTRQGIREGGYRGPAVVPGHPEESVLITAVVHDDPDLQMPPRKARLPEAVLADLRTWVKMGAPDPRIDAVPTTKPPTDIASGRRFWAFRKPVVPDSPATEHSDWPQSDIDRFILAKLEAAGLAPSPDAEPATLVRRLHFDLIGLPPSPQAVRDFCQRTKTDGLVAAMEAEVDALLASERFGERWGRHWLDVARYAESSGKEANITFPYAWRYRDYVIDAVNADVPFDRFLTEQIAGDLLPAENDAERARLLIATSFLALGPKNLDEGNPIQFAADVIDEQIDTVTRAVAAVSVACARCHDHKFDPFAMEDYYALAGIFASTETYFGTIISPANRVGGDPLVLPRGAGLPIFHQSIPAEKVEQFKAELAALQQQKAETITEALRIFWTAGRIDGELEKVDDQGQALPLAMGVLDREQRIDAPLLMRGEIDRPGETVPRGFPRVFQIDNPPKIPADRSGRLALAEWLTRPDHPLTARVMANRVWHHLFGAGIVRTVDNFGFNGERPSHPQLLDHLALKFVADGWSVKKLVRAVVLSRTYRQSSAYDERAFRNDPDNRLLWRMTKRRLDAEAIRDAMLAVSGELETTRPTGSLVARQIGDKPVSLIGLDKRLPADLDGSQHRSVYLPVLRDYLPDVLDLFDFAEPSLVTGDRDTTNVPLQALYLMNSDFMLARASALADRLTRETDDREKRIRRAFQLCFARAPGADEMQRAAAFFEQAGEVAGADAERKVLAVYCQALLCTAEFRNLD